MLRYKLVRCTLLALFLIFLFVFICNAWVIRSTASHLYSSVENIPSNKVALLLGANKKARSGYPNLFFTYRIAAVVKLYKSGKIKHVIVSGDNHNKEYDEATDMRDALMAQGIPENSITLDYAGFRTLDSVVRCKEVFGQDSITIVSQEFHNQRAVFIANYYGLKAVAFNAKDVSKGYSFRTIFREYFAKCKAVLDLYVFKTQPKFFGNKIQIHTK